MVEHLELQIEVEVGGSKGSHLIGCWVRQQESVVDEGEEDGRLRMLGCGGEGILECDGLIVEILDGKFRDRLEDGAVG